MRTITIAALSVGIMLVACTSDTSDDEDGCSDISGNYTVTPKTVGGTCPPGEDKPFTVTIAKEGGSYGVVLPGITGSCPGSLDASSCRFQAQCLISAKDGSTLVTYNVDWKFSGKVFTGSLAGALAAGIAGPKACTSTEQDEGTRL